MLSSRGAKNNQKTRQCSFCCSLLLAASLFTFLLCLARDHLSKHHDAIAIHECDAGEALAVLEGVAHEWLLRCKGAFGYFVGLQGVRILHFLSTGLLSHLPSELDDAAG